MRESSTALFRLIGYLPAIELRRPMCDIEAMKFVITLDIGTAYAQKPKVPPS